MEVLSGCVPGQFASLANLKSCVCIDLIHFEEEKAIFPLECVGDRGLRRLAVSEDAVHMDAC